MKNVIRRRKPVNLTLSLECLAGLKKLATLQGISQSAVVEILLRGSMKASGVVPSEEEIREALACKTVDRRLERALASR